MSERDQLIENAGYIDGKYWSHRDCAAASQIRQALLRDPDYKRGHDAGVADRQAQLRYERELRWKKFWEIVPGTIILILTLLFVFWTSGAFAMSQGGTVRMCQDLAALSRDVAQRRDEGFSPAAVMAIFAPSSDLEISTAERDLGVLREETEMRETVMRVVSMTYSQPQYGPAEVHDTVYSTCLDRGRAYGLVP